MVPFYVRWAVTSTPKTPHHGRAFCPAGGVASSMDLMNPGNPTRRWPVQGVGWGRPRSNTLDSLKKGVINVFTVLWWNQLCWRFRMWSHTPIVLPSMCNGSGRTRAFSEATKRQNRLSIEAASVINVYSCMTITSKSTLLAFLDVIPHANCPAVHV
jgi:hypothetical protein